MSVNLMAPGKGAEILAKAAEKILMRKSQVLSSFLFVSLLAGLNARADQPIADPFAAITSMELPNGLRLVLAPSEQARTVKIKVTVGAGHYNEDEGKSGTAHLLEHYLFTDAKMDRSQTYLDAIKEKGGSGNATTSTEETTYYATVPPKLGSWVVDIFGKILFQKTFDEELVQHSKKPVFLEIGQPNPFDLVVDGVQRLMPEAARYPDFWETEFGVKKPMYRMVAARLHTAGLTAADLKSFYDRYYSPRNMTVFVAGAFSRETLLPRLRSAFGTEPGRERRGWVDPKPVAKRGSYYRSSVSNGTPQVDIGTKVAGISHEDEVAARIYLGHVSHRLMKDLRNRRGETYTVRPSFDLSQGHGKMTLVFEAPSERYSQNLDMVEEMIEKEARKGEISAESFEEAKGLYRRVFELKDKDSGTMLDLAERFDEIRTEYPGESRNDFAVYQAMSREDYVSRLKRIFDGESSFAELSEPPLLFRFESYFLFMFVLVGWMKLARRIFARPFRNDGIRWMRKISYAPAYLVQANVAFFTVLFSTMAWVFVFRAWIGLGLIRAHFLISDYMLDCAGIGLAVIVSQLLYGAVPRKLTVSGDRLYVKSLAYRSWVAPLSGVMDIRIIRPWKLLSSPKLLFRCFFRFGYFDPCFWRPGLYLIFATGKNFFVSSRHPDAMRSELMSLVEEAKRGVGSSVSEAERESAA